MTGQRRNRLETVRSLPEVFALEDVERILGCPRGHASVYCTRWREAGLIEPVARHRSGLYFNVLRNTNARETGLYRALARIVHGPLLIAGASALNAHGWTTQFPGIPEFAVMVTRERPTFPHIDLANLSPRYPRWFGALLDQAEDVGMPGADIRRLKPEMALADALLSHHRGIGRGYAGRTVWGDAAGDLDPDAVDGAADGIMGCLRHLGASEANARLLLETVIGSGHGHHAGP